MIAAMNAPTAQGVVYELDFRLRPHGAAGPIATSLLALERHYRQDAWTWERLAMTRARVLGPQTGFSAKIARALQSALDGPDEKPKMARDIEKMRSLMDEERPPRDVWDVKLAKGGLIDIEFLSQMEILFGHMDRQRTTTDTLSEMVDGKLHNDNVTLQKAHASFLDVIQVLRLCLDSEVNPREGPEGMIELLLRQLDMPDMASAEAYLKDVQLAVRQIFVRRLAAYAASS